MQIKTVHYVYPLPTIKRKKPVVSFIKSYSHQLPKTGNQRSKISLENIFGLIWSAETDIRNGLCLRML